MWNGTVYLQMYEHTHGKKMKASAIAAMLATMLYGRRFFPYYVYNVLAGLDEEGKICTTLPYGKEMFYTTIFVLILFYAAST